MAGKNSTERICTIRYRFWENSSASMVICKSMKTTPEMIKELRAHAYTCDLQSETKLWNEIADRLEDLHRKGKWRCFHCDEVFKTKDEARAHFGPSECSVTACQVDAAHLRDLEKQLSSYRNEDTDLHRQIASMESSHQQAFMRAEEIGYSRGLKDGRELVKAKPNMIARAL